jgi:hypothetical protein
MHIIKPFWKEVDDDQETTWAAGQRKASFRARVRESLSGYLQGARGHRQGKASFDGMGFAGRRREIRSGSFAPRQAPLIDPIDEKI